MIDSSNMTDAEVFRLNGTLSPVRIEGLLDRAMYGDKVEGVDAHIEEARGCYPHEGFLESNLDRLRALAKRVRGENRDELLELIHELDQLQDELVRDAEYGRDELRQALKQLGNG